MEDALALTASQSKENMRAVLILVLMEDALAQTQRSLSRKIWLSESLF